MSTLVESPLDASAAALRLASLQLSPSKAAAAVRPPSKSDKEITVMLSVQQPAGDSGFQTTELIHVLADETIRDVKLRLSKASWFSSAPSKLVFGDRELLEHETVSQLLRVDDTASSHLHILVAMSQIESVQIATLSQAAGAAPAAVGTPRTPAKSALTTSLSAAAPQGLRCEGIARDDSPARVMPAARQRLSCSGSISLRYETRRTRSTLEGAAAQVRPSPDKPPPNPSSTPPRSLVPASSAVAPASGELAGRTVVHLLVSKAAKVNWRHLKDDTFELSVSSADTVETLKRRISSVDSNIELDAVDLVYGGQVGGGERWAAPAAGSCPCDDAPDAADDQFRCSTRRALSGSPRALAA
jgi:hypothetical protein